jgi:hypothetical protein
MAILVLTGCRSVQPSVPPDVSTAMAEEAVNPANDLAEFVAGYIRFHINDKTGLKFERIKTGAAQEVELVTAKDQSEGMMFMKVREFSLNSSDLLSKPLEAKLVLELIILDAQKSELYQRSVTGHYEVGLEELMKQASSRKLAEAVVKSALSQFAEDLELKRTIARLKYGAIGNLARFM